jgi:molecular chaperone Hsp33
MKNNKDIIQRYLFEEHDVRGEIVQLEKSWQAILANHDYPAIIQHYLGEIVAATVLLAATLKIDGSLSIQVSGNGIINLMVAECRNDLSIRAIAKYNHKKLKQLDQKVIENKLTSGSELSALLSGGNLVITIEQNKGQRYQGIVALQGNSIAEILENHLLQSEQLRTKIVLACNDTISTGLLLQELPQQMEKRHQWDELALLANTLTEDELLALEAREIIHRLFNEYNIRVFDPQAIKFKCSCSQQKVSNMLLSLDYKEAKDIIHQSEFIEVNCEFCNKVYRFDELDITEIFSAKHKPTIH